MGREPFVAEIDPPLPQIVEYVRQVLVEKMRKRECVMQGGAPAGEALPIGLIPEVRDQRPDEKLLREAHPRMGWHLEAAQFNQAQAAGGSVGRVELVDAELRTMRVT